MEANARVVRALGEGDGRLLQGERAMRRSSSRSQIVKARLQEVASDFFYRRGIRAVGINEITITAGVTKPTLYRFFPSKDAMVEDCVAADADRMLSVAHHLLANIEDRGQLAKAIGRLLALDTRSHQGRGLFLLNVAVEYPEAGHPVREIVASAVQGLRARLAAVLSSGVADAGTAAAAADHIILLIQGASAGCHSLGCKASVEALETSVETVLQHYNFAGPLTLRRALQATAH